MKHIKIFFFSFVFYCRCLDLSRENSCEKRAQNYPNNEIIPSSLQVVEINPAQKKERFDSRKNRSLWLRVGIDLYQTDSCFIWQRL
jgi:hypothetical protein